jgi:hypothetical protein
MSLGTPGLYRNAMSFHEVLTMSSRTSRLCQDTGSFNHIVTISLGTPRLYNNTMWFHQVVTMSSKTYLDYVRVRGRSSRV